jgi:hypothetical protein
MNSKSKLRFLTAVTISFDIDYLEISEMVAKEL